MSPASADPLSEVASVLQVRADVHIAATLEAPWAAAFRPSNAAVFHLMQRGTGCLVLDGGRCHPLQEGDVVLLTPGRGHRVGSDQATVPRVTLDPDGWSAGAFQVHRWAGPDAPDLLVCGLLHVDRGIRHPLLDALPEVLLVPAETGAAAQATGLAAIADELHATRPGWRAVADHLAGALFIRLMRRWLENGAQPAGWLQAVDSPGIGATITLMHQRPEHAWTVHELANRAAMSRSAYAAEFTRLVGEGPIAYLTRWRMLRAAEGLRRERWSVTEAATRSGYASVAAFHRAFQRHTGHTPASYRRSWPT